MVTVKKIVLIVLAICGNLSCVLRPLKPFKFKNGNGNGKHYRTCLTFDPSGKCCNYWGVGGDNNNPIAAEKDLRNTVFGSRLTTK